MKIGFIGCGNMAAAIIKGLTGESAGDFKEITVFDKFTATAERASEQFGVCAAQSPSEVFECCDVIILAVKPNVIASVLQEQCSIIAKKQPLLVSIAAGKTLSYLEEQLGGTQYRLVRVMPNINAKAGEAMCGYCGNAGMTAEDEKTVTQIFSATGRVLKVEESLFPVFSVLAGCGPAFAFMFIDALARAGVQNGLSKQNALQIAAQTVLGSAKMILDSGEHPWALIDQVCSPGGTTIEAVTALQADGMEAAVHHAVNAAVEKDKRL